MKTNRLSILALALALVLSLISGCTTDTGSDAGSNSGNTGAPPSPGTSAGATGSTTPDNSGGSTSDEVIPDNVLEGIAEAKAATGDSDKLTIAYSCPTVTNNGYMATLANSMQTYVEGLGHEFILSVSGDYGSSLTQQINNIEDLISSGIDGLVLYPSDANAMVPVLERAKEEGVAVVLVDSTIAEGNDDLFTAFVGTESWPAGTKAGESMVDVCEPGELFVIQGIEGLAASIDRCNGFREVVEANGFEIVAEEFCNASNTDSMDFVENALVAHPNVKGIFTMSDCMLDGILMALQDAGYEPGEVKVISVDGTKEAVDFIEEGWLTVDIAQRPGTIAAYAAEILISDIQGTLDEAALEKFIDSGTFTFSADNMEEARANSF